jgi:hypothetical protein
MPNQNYVKIIEKVKRKQEFSLSIRALFTPKGLEN